MPNISHFKIKEVELFLFNLNVLERLVLVVGVAPSAHMSCLGLNDSLCNEGGGAFIKPLILMRELTDRSLKDTATAGLDYGGKTA